MTVTDLEALAELRHRDPGAVRDVVLGALESLPPQGPEHVTATWVLGLAAHELGRPAEAIRLFRRALRLRDRGADDRRVAVVRASLAMSLLATGDTAGAYRELTRARADAPDAVATIDPLWAVLLQRTGRHEEALETFNRTLPIVRKEHDAAGIARLLLNRGTLLVYRGQVARAQADLFEAEEIAVERGLWLLAAMAAHNIGFAAGRRGDISTGLAGFDRARASYRAVGDPPRQVAVLAADHCELLLRAGLAYDARVGAERALQVLGSHDGVDAAHLAEIRLLLAQALLADDDARSARATAAAAADAFRIARRPVWAALADYVAVQAEVAEAEDQLAAPPALISRTRRIARTLDRNGWPTEALHVRTLLGRVALSLGDRATVVRELREAGTPLRAGTVDARTTAWHATALRRLAEGDRAGAKRALRRGLRLVDQHRAGMATTELRAGAGVRATELARLGLRLALADRRPAEVLRWAERWRAGALRLPPATPPADDLLADLTAQLHDARSELRVDTLEGRAVTVVQRRVSRLEEAVRERHLQATGATSSTVGRGLDLAAVRSQLGRAVLIEYIAVENRLVAVTVSATGQQLHDLGPMAPVGDEIRHLLAAQRRLLLAPSRGQHENHAPAGGQATATATRLQDRLLSALRLEEGAPLVIVPTGVLHGLPWAALPTLFGRPLVVAPSADLWQRRSRSHGPVDGGDVVLIAGPDLPGAQAEVQQLARSHPSATVLTGPAATVEAALAALQGAELVHLAAHGHFRSDNPFFSSILLADGLLTVAEMEHLTSAPRTVVLPACDAARSDVRVGDELIGTTTALLARGVRSVLAPVLRVPDELTTGLMMAVHRHLSAGRPPSESLALAAQETDVGEAEHALAASFVCVGAGESDHY